MSESLTKNSPINLNAEAKNLEDLTNKTYIHMADISLADLYKGTTALSKYKEAIKALLELRDSISKHSKKVNQYRKNTLNEKAFSYVSNFDYTMKKLDEVIEETQKKIQDIEKDIKSFENELGLETLENYQKNENSSLEYIQTLQAKAKEIYQKRGTLCDTEGFYQHSGECWSDAFQQVLLNANGLKERIQYVFIFYPVPELDTLANELFVPYENIKKGNVGEYVSMNRDLIQKQKKWAKLYLLELQKRFLRHYTTEGKRRNLKEEICALKQPADVAREQLLSLSKEALARKSGKEGQTSAILAKLGQYKKSKENRYTNLAGEATVSLEGYKKNPKRFAGGRHKDLFILMNIIQNLMFNTVTLQTNPIDFTQNTGYSWLLKVTKDSNGGVIDTASACIISLGLYDKGERISGHEVAFYECGNQSVYYEDNTGIVPFPWKRFLKTLNEKYNESPRIEFYIISYRTKDIYYTNSFYPVIVCPQTGKKYTYFNATGTDLIEFSTNYVNSEGSLQIKPAIKYSQILDEILFVYTEKTYGIGNVGYTPELNSRIRKNPVVQALTANNISTALNILSKENIPKDAFFRNESAGNIPLLHYIVMTNAPIEILEGLLKKGFDPNQLYNDNTVLNTAIYSKNIPAIEVLSKYGGTIDFESFSIFFDNKFKESLPSLQALLKNNETAKEYLTKGDEEGETLLHLAVLGDSNTDILELLISSGANINAQEQNGMTPLISAVMNNKFDIVRFLCQKGADIKIPGTNKTAVVFAKTNEMKEILAACSSSAPSGGRRCRGKKTKKQKKLKISKTYKGRK